MRSKKKKKNRIILRVHERKLLPRWQTEIEQNLALLCRTRHDRGKRGRLVTHRCAGLEKRSNYLARNACSREHNFPAATNEEKEQKEREGKRIKIQRRRERERERGREKEGQRSWNRTNRNSERITAVVTDSNDQVDYRIIGGPFDP